MHLFKQSQMESHTHSHTSTFTQRGAMQQCEEVQFSLHLRAHPHLVTNLHTPKLSSVMLKCTTHIQYIHIIKGVPLRIHLSLS